MTAMLYRLGPFNTEDFAWSPAILMDQNNLSYLNSARFYMQLRKDLAQDRAGNYLRPAALSFGPGDAPPPFGEKGETSSHASLVAVDRNQAQVQLEFLAPAEAVADLFGLHYFDVFYLNVDPQAPIKRRVVAYGTAVFRPGVTS